METDEEKLRVLLVDDDEVDRMAVCRYLKKSSLQAEVEEAEDGAAGMTALKERQFDCVFLDYRLPGFDGLDVLQSVRRDGIRTPIIMLTRQGDEQIAVELMKAGASDYINKEKMSPETLQKSIQYVVRSVRAEEELRESQERYAVAVQGANDGIWDWNLKTGEIYFSQRWKSMLGREENEIGGSPDDWFCCIHPDDRQRVEADVRAHLTGKTPYFESEYRISHRDGSYRWALSRGLAVTDRNGRPTRVAGSQTDITERKRSEAEREELYQKALDADRRKDEFLSVVSHELRTPLTAILGWTQVIRSGKVNEQHIRHGLDVIEKSARMQARIVNDLLDVSQIIKGKAHVNMQPVKLSQVIEMAIESVIPSAKEKSIEILYSMDSLIPAMYGDPDRLQQVVWNLLCNAVKFTPEGGRVEVHLVESGKDAMITVRDSGRGIHPEFLPYVFDAFRQEENVNTRGHGGLGLGLSIVRHFVELHKGSVSAASDGPGKGAMFTIVLPLRIPAEEPAEFASGSGPAVTLNGLEILVVEDDGDTLEMLTTALQQYGACVLAASSAAEALNILRTFWPNVLISDIAMPKQDGYSFIRDVRALELEQGKRIQSIALTAYASTEDRRRALTAGYQAHLAKPVDPSHLAAVVAELAGK
jgi:PAS domain S-box-containing protein